METSSLLLDRRTFALGSQVFWRRARFPLPRRRLRRRCDKYPSEPKCSGMDPIVFGEVKTASGTHKITAATPINTVKEWGAQAAECALAWRFTRKPEYLAKAKRMLEVSIAAYHEAYANGREVCWYSTSRILALTAYDWIFEALTPAAEDHPP